MNDVIEDNDYKLWEKNKLMGGGMWKREGGRGKTCHLKKAGLCSDLQSLSARMVTADHCIPPLNTSHISVSVSQRAVILNTLLSCITLLTVTLNLFVVISISHFRHRHFS